MSRVRLWKIELQGLATELGIDIEVHQLPPGTRKWNQIEHKLFSFISMNWPAKSLVSYRVIVARPSIPKGSSSPSSRWRTSTSPVPTSVENGATPSILK